MPDILSTSLTGMLAFQRAMELTGHNIANANTPGYSRQVAHFSTRPGVGVGNAFIGSGTQISSIKRVYDTVLGEQLQSTTSNHSRFSTLESLSSKIDSLLADPQTGLSGSMQSFFNALQDVTNDPGSIPARQAVLGEADGVLQRFESLDLRFSQLNDEVNERIAVAVDDINRLSESIAGLNQKISLASSRTGQPPNDLLDQRDAEVLALSKLVSVSTVLQDDSAMNVYIGSGQPVVTGIEVRQLTARGSEFDPTRVQISYQGATGDTPIDQSLGGGELGGLFDFRSQVLEPTRQTLGKTALGFVQQFNGQHAEGLDLRGNPGGDFFTIADPTVLTSSQNTGSGGVSASINDVSALTGGDYALETDGTNFTLRRMDTSEVVTLAGSGTVGDPFTAEGVSFVISGTVNAGDRFLIRPARDAAESVVRSIQDPQSIAMALPVAVSSSSDNLGDASVSGVSIADSSAAGFAAPAVIEFTSPTTYSVDGAGSFAFQSGEPITVNGVNVTLVGAPQSGDQFSLGPNTGVSGDNRNGLLLTAVQTQKVLDGATISINESYGQLVANVGSTSRQVQANLEAQSIVLANTEDAMDSKSGVNLDEEAANLIRYQQAYQAVAQVVSVANTVFDSLLAATRR